MFNNPRLKTTSEVRVTHPAFVEETIAKSGTWTTHVLTPTGDFIQIPLGSSIRMNGFAGSAVLAIACDEEGSPLFDKLVCRQNPGVAIVAWGVNKDGEVKIAYLTQVRPFALDQENPEDTSIISFGQIPMGFMKPQPGQSLQEAIEATVCRELGEEIGAQRVLAIEIPTPATYWQDPTFVENGTYVAFAKVDLNAIGNRTDDGHEQIKTAEFLPVEELLRRIAAGRTFDGTIHHMGLSLGPLMMFFARHPEMFLGSRAAPVSVYEE